ncbi:MAG: pimeloyl-ACP methyl ester carboxylesterase [Flavobacteriaceae bacterium]|jgi:pimeloyl-ACP methyl ester carboxylesterase
MQESNRKYLNNQSKFIEVHGMNVHYRNEGNGPNIVLLHGAFSSLHTFDAWTEHFKKDYCITRIDLPGYGYTGAHPKADYSLPSYLSVLQDFLNKLNIESCILVGNSLGGLLSWEFALRNPKRVRKLILIDAVGFVDQLQFPTPFTLARNHLIRQVMKIGIPKLYIKKQVRAVYADRSRIKPGIIDRYFDLFVGEKNHLAFLDFVKQDIKDNSSQLNKLNVPTLILWGKEDRWIPVKIAELFAEKIAHSELIIYDDCGHVPMEEIPDQTIRDVSSFLQLPSKT